MADDPAEEKDEDEGAAADDDDDDAPDADARTRARAAEAGEVGTAGAAVVPVVPVVPAWWLFADEEASDDSRLTSWNSTRAPGLGGWRRGLRYMASASGENRPEWEVRALAGGSSKPFFWIGEKGRRSMASAIVAVVAGGGSWSRAIFAKYWCGGEANEGRGVRARGLKE